jgi:hypothetical protein
VSKNAKSTLALIDMFETGQQKKTASKKKKVTLRIVSFNLAFGVQKNKLYDPSEQVMVKRCQKHYSDSNGASGIPNLSACTRNAAVGLVSNFFGGDVADVVGVQEAHGPTIPALLACIQQGAGPKNTFVVAGKETCCVIYNEATMGTGSSFAVQSKHNGLRCSQGVFFVRSDLLFLNCWFGHGFNIKKVLEGLKLDTLKHKPKRIIITMDCNDPKGLSKDIELNILGLVLRQPGKPRKTCCEDSKTYYGDYIFDSSLTKPLMYGVPNGLNGKTQLMSDHLPVALVTHLTE